MMHILLRVLVGTVALLAVTAPALAAGQVDWDACKGDDPDRSIAACTRIIQGRGETAQRLANAHYNRGVAYKDKGDLDRAIADFTEAIRLNPRHVTALGNRGAAYSAKDDNDRAIADFNEAIRLDPNFGDAYFNRGITYQDKRDLDRAIADYSEVIRLNPKFTQADSYRGFTYANRSDLDRAIADYNEAHPGGYAVSTSSTCPFGSRK